MTARTTQAILPVHLPRLGATLARGVRAGRWVFATGLNGAVPSGDFRAEHLKIATNWSIHASSGYSPALAAGEFLFVPGQTAEARDTAQGPLDPDARMPPGHLWKGTPIKLETKFIVEQK